MSDPFTIIRDQADIEDAPTGQILWSYNALTGESVQKFSSREVGKRRLANAILAAADASGHLGVPRGTRPPVLTFAERAARGERSEPEPAVKPSASVQATPPDETGATGLGAAETNPYRPGTVEHGLWAAGNKSRSEAKSPRKPPPGPGRAIPVTAELTGTGTSKFQAASIRAKIVEHLEALPDKRDRILSMSSKFEGIKGHLQKLVGLKHVLLRDADGKEIAQ